MDECMIINVTENSIWLCIVIHRWLKAPAHNKQIEQRDIETNFSKRGFQGSHTLLFHSNQHVLPSRCKCYILNLFTTGCCIGVYVKQDFKCKMTEDNN